MASPRVLFFSESQGWSGGAKQLLRLAERLRAGGWDIRVACPRDGQTFRKAEEMGLSPIDLHPREDYDVPTAWRLARLLSREGIDLLHAHHPRAHAVGLIAAYLSRRPPLFVVTRRVSFAPQRNPFSLFKYRSGRISGFIAVAGSIRQALLEAGVEPSRVTVIPSGVDLDTFTPRPRDEALAAELGLDARVPVVGKIANYGSWKGQDVALAAASRLKAQGRKAVFLFAGRDTDGPEIRGKARALGLADADVRFLGFREDVPRLLSLLAVSINAAIAGEGLSGALRESFAMNVPVAASDAGGNGELVEDGVTGRLSPAGDADGLARAVASLLDDPAGAKRMAEEGRRRVAERYGADRVAALTADFYRSLLAGAGRASSGDIAAQASSTPMSRQDSQELETRK